MSATKIIIPKPCNKGWDNMTPNTNGRHCDTCDKTVVDFTQMNKEEIKSYFIQKSGTKICGHFKASQVEPYQPKLHRKLIALYNSIDQKISIRIFKKISLASVAACMFLVGCQEKPEVVGEMENVKCNKIEKTTTGTPTPKTQEEISGAVAVPLIKDSLKPSKKCNLPEATLIEGKMEIKEEPMVDGDMLMEN